MAMGNDIKTPLYQKVGEDLHKVLVETSADQVKTADGGTVEAKLASLSSAVAGQTGVSVVADMAARDALDAPKVGDQCWVKDATGDSSVKTGAAKYIYESAAAGWVKTAEAESMDVVVQWADVADKPASAVVDIDAAVAKKHEHANKAAVLDKLADDGAGNLLFGGARINDGKVDVAFTADIADVPANLRDGGLLIVSAGA